MAVGELPRGKVKEVIGSKDRTASTLIKELLALDYIESTTPKSPIRLKFNAFLLLIYFRVLSRHSKSYKSDSNLLKKRPALLLSME